MLENSERRFYTESDINLPNYTWTEYPVQFKGNGMVTTDRNATGRFTIIGTTVFYHIDIVLTGVQFNSTNSLYVSLPFPAAYHTNTSQGALHDVSTGKTHHVLGLTEQYSREAQLYHFNNQQETIPMTHNVPVNLDQADYIHIGGWYEAVFND